MNGRNVAVHGSWWALPSIGLIALVLSGCIPKGYTGWISDAEVGRLNTMFRDNPVTVIFHDMKIRFDLPEETVWIDDRVTLENVSDSPVDSAFLTLPYGSTALAVEDSSGAPLEFTNDPYEKPYEPKILHKVPFVFSHPLEPGRIREITIRYVWEVNDNDSEIDDDEIILAGQSRWFPDARIDLPAFTRGDRFEFIIEALIPREQYAFLDGELLTVEDVGPVSRFRWRSWGVMMSMNLHSKAFIQERHNMGDHVLDFFLIQPWETVVKTKSLGKEIALAIDLLTERLGERRVGGDTLAVLEGYPNLKALGSGTNCAYMNAIQLYTGIMMKVTSFLDELDSSGPPEDLEPISTLYHELAHLWWGTSLEPVDYGRRILTEGLAEYSAAGVIGSRFGKEQEAKRFDGYRKKYLRRKESGPFLDPPVLKGHTLTVWVNYTKGPLFYRMLADLVGEELLWEGLRTFYEQYAGGAPRVADLQLVMEAVSGEALGWFFHQWLGTVDLPDYTIEAVRPLETNKGWAYRVTVSNRGENRMPVEIAALSEREEGPVRSGSTRVWIDPHSRIEVEVAASSPARSIEVDPDKIVIQSDYSNDVWNLAAGELR